MKETAWLVVFSGFMVVAAVLDLRTRRIPNALNLAAAAAGLAFSYWRAGLPGIESSLVGFCIPLFTLLPLAVMTGWLGGGDVKLLAAAGAWFGTAGLLGAVLCGSIAGGIWAVAHVIIKTLRQTAWKPLSLGLLMWQSVSTWQSSRRETIAYGPALAAGCIAWAIWGGILVARLHL